MSALRLALIMGGLSALVGCSMLVNAGELSDGDNQLDTEGEITTDAGRSSSGKDGGGSSEDSGSNSTDTPQTGEGDPAGGATDDGGTGDQVDSGGVVIADPNPCAGKPDGFAYKAGSSVDRCCGGQATKMDSTNSCGACGVKCPSGFGCGQAMPGKWGCNCATNDQCEAAGYGAGATCYTDGTGSFCNCQCPGGAVSCSNVCKGGAKCTDDLGQNYCAY
jgi:hypothetical protein